jgi:glycosyltransferase involved in cell wall biosynthesis
VKVALVAPSAVPFTLGGAERANAGVVREINANTAHDAELIRLPVREQTLAGLLDGYATFARLDLSHFDLVISTKYPAWMVGHPNHVVHMFHPLRGLYDTYHLFGKPLDVTVDDPTLLAVRDLMGRDHDRGLVEPVLAGIRRAMDELGEGDPVFELPGPFAREVVHWLDAIALAPGAVRRHLALSRRVASRPGYFPAGVQPEVVYVPSDLEGLHAGPFRHLFTVSRLDGPKRFDLLIEAMRHVRTDVPLLIAGTGPEGDRLKAMAAADRRIRFCGFVGDDELTGLYADAVAVPFIPLDEDYGLIALEAMAAGKPVVTCSDSGGVTELVADGVTGFVTPPDPAALGRALDRVASDAALAERLGAAGRDRGARITWSRAVAALLRGTGLAAPADTPSRPRHDRRPHPKLVVLSTFKVHPPVGGGQLRCFHLYGAMTDRFDVEIVSLVPSGTAATSVELAPGFRETTAEKSPAHEQQEHELHAAAGFPVTDMAASALIAESPAYLTALRNALRGSVGAVLAHPFLLPALDAIGAEVPVFYDAHNAETVLKGALVPGDETGRYLRDLVAAVERAAVERSPVTTVCSAEDAATLASLTGVPAGRFVEIPNGSVVTGVPFVALDERRAGSRRWRERYASTHGGPVPEALALFLASWHPPNLDAADVIIDLATRMPEVVFLLGGSHGDAFRRHTLPDNVVLAGVLTDRAKRSLLRAADVALNPMRQGSGTNLKIIEYLAHGVPVVTTPLGARGLDLRDGRDVVIAEPAAFASAIRSVIDDAAAAHERAERARRLVEEHYDWRVLGRRMADVLAGALGLPAR